MKHERETLPFVRKWVTQMVRDAQRDGVCMQCVMSTLASTALGYLLPTPEDTEPEDMVEMAGLLAEALFSRASEEEVIPFPTNTNLH
tara:strand:+ start:83 stop:343 length:261 start_codon:yes stop_codon:yes gene_type:complete